MPTGVYKRTAEHKAKISDAIRASWRSTSTRVEQRERVTREATIVLDALPGTVAQVSARTGMEPSTVARRILQLRREGKIAWRKVNNSRGFSWAKEWYRA